MITVEISIIIWAQDNNNFRLSGDIKKFCQKCLARKPTFAEKTKPSLNIRSLFFEKCSILVQKKKDCSDLFNEINGIFVLA